MDPCVKKTLLVQDFEWEQFLGTLGMGEKSFNTAAAIKGYYEEKRTRIVKGMGEYIESDSRVYLDAAEVAYINEGDRITITASSKKHTVLKVHKYYNRLGVLDYGVVFLWQQI